MLNIPKLPFLADCVSGQPEVKTHSIIADYHFHATIFELEVNGSFIGSGVFPNVI